MSKVLEYTRKGFWLLGVNNLFIKLLSLFYQKQGLGITSCLARNDFNVAFSIITLMLLTNFYNQNPKATTKIIIQMLTILFLADIVWIVLFSSAWAHNSESDNSKSNEGESLFWDSLWFIHKIVYVLAYIELLVKGFLLYYLIVDFKEKYKLSDLFNFNYDDGKNSLQPQNMDEMQNFDNSNNFVNESNNSYAENFQNKY